MSNGEEDLTEVLVVSSDPLARAALARALAGDAQLRVVGRSDPGAELAGVLAQLTPDVLLFDAGLVSAETPEALSDDHPPVAWLVSSPEAAMDGLRAGARAVLRRDVDPPVLSAALRSVSHGLAVLDRDFLKQVLAGAAPSAKPGGDLTAREREVLEELARGLSNKVIADRLSISEHTVKFHVNAVMSKLNAQSRTEAVVLAARRGWLSL